MPELIHADEARLSEILDATYPIWNEGLSRDGYRRWTALQARSPWGQAHLSRVALVDGNELLASAKWYDLGCELAGQPCRVLGIGAVFTPDARRGRGHAKDLIARMLAQAEGSGYHAAVLFSEIGAPYYEAMGFTVIPRDTVTLDVVFPKQGPPATLVRAGEDADLPYLAEFHHDAPLRLVRTPDLIKFGIVKRRGLAASAPIGSRVVEFFVSEEGHRPVAYVLISRGPSGNLGDGPDVMWLEACADRDPSGARVGAMLQVLRARTAGEAWPPFYSWLPHDWLPQQIRIVGSSPADAVMMIRPLGKNYLPSLAAKDVIWWHADAF
jgi:GNAT superfamily N-acetyltransferase